MCSKQVCAQVRQVRLRSSDRLKLQMPYSCSLEEISMFAKKEITGCSRLFSFPGASGLLLRFRSRRVFALCAFVFASLLVPSSEWGQNLQVGDIHGQLTDQSGAVVPGANINLT